jgi:hypothetical protein
MRNQNGFNSDEFKLSQAIHNLYSYEIDDLDLEFLRDLFTQLSPIRKTWSKIGYAFESRDIFYEDVLNLLKSKLNSEYEKEKSLLNELDAQLNLARTLCDELELHFNQIDAFSILNELTLIDQLDILKREIEDMCEQKQNKIETFNQLVKIKNSLCTKLSVNKSHIYLNRVPSEKEFEQLENELLDLQDLEKKRKTELEIVKLEILNMINELDFDDSCCSNLDPFLIELIHNLTTQKDEIRLGEQELRLASDFRDRIKIKYMGLCNYVRQMFLDTQKMFFKLGVALNDTEHYFYMILFHGYDHVAQLYPKHALLKQLDLIRENLRDLSKDYEKKLVEEMSDYLQKMFLSPEQVAFYKESPILDLGMLEERLEKLIYEYAECEDFFLNVAEWMKVWKEYKKFEHSSRDPERFKRNGYSSLDEEKSRKAFETKLGKLEEEMKALASEFKSIRKKQFEIYGFEYEMYLGEEKSAFMQDMSKKQRSK